MQGKFLMFKMLSELNSEVKGCNVLSETIEALFETDELEALFETASTYLQKAIGALNAGKHPFAKETKVADPTIIAGLITLGDPDLAAGHNIDDIKMAKVVLPLVDKSRNVFNFVQKVGKLAGREVSDILRMAQESPKELAQKLVKLQMYFGQVEGKLQAKKAA